MKMLSSGQVNGPPRPTSYQCQVRMAAPCSTCCSEPPPGPASALFVNIKPAVNINTDPNVIHGCGRQNIDTSPLQIPTPWCIHCTILFPECSGTCRQDGIVEQTRRGWEAEDALSLSWEKANIGAVTMPVETV